MNAARKPIVVVGSINIDFVVTTDQIPVAGETLLGSDFQVHYGGKGANQAVAVARLGYPVEMIGKVGSDIFGEQLRAGLRNAGVGAAAVGTAEGTSGIATIIVARDGENSIVVTPGANSRVMPAYLDEHAELIKHAGMVLSQLEIPIETVSYLAELCGRYGVPLMLDPAPAQALPPPLLDQTAWFTPNETEAAFYAQGVASVIEDAPPSDIANAFLDLGARSVALKMGARGVLLASKAGKHELIPAPCVEAIDTTAAGDAFNGAFAVALMLGNEPARAAGFACAAAAISVTRRGAQPSMPTLEEVERLLKQ